MLLSILLGSLGRVKHKNFTLGTPRAKSIITITMIFYAEAELLTYSLLVVSLVVFLVKIELNNA